MRSYVIGMLAVALAIGLCSFTFRRARDKWFRFDGNSNSAVQVLNPAQYTDIVGTPTNPPNILNLLAFIHVESATEVYVSGPNAGKPTVDVLSDIYIDLNANVVGRTFPTEVANRILIK